MTRIDTEKLGERAFVSYVNNHLTTFFVEKPGFKKNAALLGVNYGSVDTVFEYDGKKLETPLGVAHFLEHKLFDMPDGLNVLQLFSRMGASPNAFTSNSATAYHFECTSGFSEAFELLLRCVFTPYFTTQSVEKERGIIGQEISMYRDMPVARMHDELMPMLYRQHPVRHPIIGTFSSIRDITHTTLYDCYNAFYRPSNMVLTVVGDLDFQAVADTAARLVPDSGTDHARPVLECLESSDILEYEKVITMDVPQPMFAIGVKLPHGNNSLEWEIRCKLALDALVGSSSGLYAELYNTGLIDSSFSANPFLFRGGGILSFMGRSREPLAVRDALLREAARLSETGIDSVLFERVKRAEWGDRLRALDNPMAIARGAALDYMSGTDFFSLSRVFDGINAESLTDIFATIDKMAIVQCWRNEHGI